ncbi:MAG: hypothetical protein LUM44_22605 [Pyrinomonadaceae bacterium]|nr:hypothetical protein [Pyrinomonadaceae bacterium]
MTPSCLIITPPFSPNTSNPLLGPATLKSHVEHEGFEIHTMDLNILYMDRFKNIKENHSKTVGDHDTDERQIDRAREHFADSLCLPEIDPERVPCCDDANSSLPHSFDELETALNNIMQEGFWTEFFREHIFSKKSQPAVLGISIMGPSQVLMALLFASLSKKFWKGTTVVAGGSHITLLASKISKDSRYGGSFDFFAPGHSEDVLVELLKRLARNEDLNIKGLLRAGKGWMRSEGILPENRLAPVFDKEELAYYQNGHLTLPIQLARGCAYGRCTYCTYPVVEEFEKVEVETMARKFVSPLLNLSPTFISVKDSLLTVADMSKFGQVVTSLDSSLGWSATTKVHSSMTPKYMKSLYDNGCRTLEMGIETIHLNSQKFFGKIEPLTTIESVLDAAVSANISIVINMIYGVLGETIEQAHKQMNWWLSWKKRYPDKIFGVHNMLQIDEGSPLTRNPAHFGLKLYDKGPWSFTYVWNAPDWRPDFERHINENGGRVQ